MKKRAMTGIGAAMIAGATITLASPASADTPWIDKGCAVEDGELHCVKVGIPTDEMCAEMNAEELAHGAKPYRLGCWRPEGSPTVELHTYWPLDENPNL